MPTPRQIADLRRQLERYEIWTTEFPLSELRTTLAIIDEQIAPIRSKQRELETLRVRLDDQLKSLPDLEFLASTRNELAPFIDETTPLESNISRLTSNAAQLDRMIVACDRIDELCRRLGRHPDWPNSRDTKLNADEKVKSTIADLDKIGDALATELKRIEADEELAAEFLASLSSITPDNWDTEPAASMITSSSDALRVLLIGQVLIDRNGTLKLASADSSFIATIAACLSTYDHTALVSLLVDQVNKLGLQRLTMALSALSPSMVYALADHEDLPPLLGEALYLVALFGHQQGLLGPLSAKVRSTPEIVRLVELTQQMVLHRDLSELVTEIKMALSANADSLSQAPQGPTPRELRQAVLDKITHHPGMTRLHAKLRLYAQAQFLRPLKELVEANDPAAAHDEWERHGTVEVKLQSCLDALDQIDRRHLADSHRHNTRSYLVSFEDALLRWESKTRDERADATTVSLSSLITDIRTSDHPQNRTFCAELHRITHVPGASPPLGMQSLCVPPARMLVDPEQFVKASHIESFILCSQNRPIPCLVYLADLAREISRGTPRSPGEIIDEYLRRRAMLAARRAAGDNPVLLKRIDDAVTRSRTDLLKKSESLIATAKKVAIESESVSETLQLFLLALDDENFVDAEAFILDLDEQLRRYRILQDPARSYAHKFLGEIGEQPNFDDSLDALNARIDELRSRHRSRRLHIERLNSLQEHKLIGTYISSHAHALIRRIDLPTHWPSNERQASEVADSIDVAIVFLDTRASYHTQQPKVVAALIDGLPKYIVERLAKLSEQRDENPLAELSALIRGYHPAERIVECIGALAHHSERPEHEHTFGSPQRNVERRSRRLSATTASEGDFLREIHIAIERDAQRWLSDDPGDLSLERAIKISDWVAVRQIAARNISRRAGQNGQQRSLSQYEAIFAYAETRDVIRTSLDTAPPSLVLYFVAVFWSRGQLSIWLTDSHFQGILIDALGGKKTLPERIKALGAGTPDSTGYMWFTTMISEASRVAVRETPVSALIADQMWSLEPKANIRADLLHWLYQARRHEALSHLARLTPRPSFVMQCIRAFERAESAPDARPAALQIAAAFREQAESKSNTKPWTILFLTLEQTNPESDHDRSPVKISVPDSIVQRVDDDIFEVMLYIEPRFTADPAETLTLEFPDGATLNLLDANEDILNPREMPIQRPLPKDVKDGDIFDLPYTLKGRTFRGREFEARDEVTLEVSGNITPPLQSHELSQAWPGASGSPVLYQEGFFGRERECREIERCICADDRQRSLMLYGQRRVGKTSLLLEMVRRLPPDERRVTGIYIDVAGLDLPADRSMAAQLFNKIVDALDDPRNEALKSALDTVRDPRKLARNLQPEVSLFTALHSLKDRLRDASHGQIRRLALFIDEFDRFVEPLMSSPQSEKDADQMMWALRQIVQQSQDISLVLAGSGLQRVFTRDYARPLYGSIAQVEINPFSWESDKHAILDIFVPTPVRGRLVHGSVESVGQHATQMCGGHPYFLALVGQAAGVYARGRNVNVHLINAAARELINGSLPDLQRRVDAQLFYAHIFETLRRVPEQDQRLAQLILVNIASRTTAALPWLNRSDAIDDPDINRERESDREHALQLLIDEGAVESGAPRERGAQVRIAVPLTALAVRHSETTIRRQALQWRAEHQGPKK